MGLFNFNKKRSLGIDIGTASIKMVELDKSSGRFVLQNYAMFEQSSGGQVMSVGSEKEQRKKQLMTDDDIVYSIKEMIRTAGIKTKNAVMSIPSFPTFATTITMKYVSEEDIANSIQYEARKYIPVPLEDLQLDWSIIKSDAQFSSVEKKDNKPSVEVLLVAVPKDDIARYKYIAKNAGLKLKALELESFALARALIGNDASPFCIVSIGGRSTSIFIIDNGYQRISHDYEVGGFEITRAIAESLNVSIERAETLKKNYGTRDVNDNVIRDAMKSLLDMMVFETKKTIQNYEQLKKTQINQVLLVGGLANMPDFVRYFSEKLERSVVLGDAMGRVQVPKQLNQDIRKELNATFAVSLGLAMRETS